MTIVESSPRKPISPMLLRQAIQLCWTCDAALNGGGRRRSRFVLEIELEGEDRAMVGAWIEQGESQRSVLARHRLNVITCQENHTLHIDVVGDNGDGKIAAISIIAGEHSRSHNRPLYAHTSLLARAGLRPGSYDAPTID